MTYIFLILNVLLSFNTLASRWAINDDHSELFFSVEYLQVSEVTGRFKKISGSVEFDKNGNPQSLYGSIEAQSIDTGNTLRDGHLKGHDFFQTRVYPLIIFSSRSFQPLGNGKFQVMGDLILRNIKKPLSLELEISSVVKDTWNYPSRFIKLSTRLKRSDYLLKWNKTLVNQKYLVGNEIKLWGSFQVQPSHHMTPASKHMIPDTSYIRERERINRGEIKETRKTFKTSLGEVQRSGGLKLSSSDRSKLESKTVVGRDSFWWVAFWVLGLQGFLASMVVGFTLKDWMSRKYFFRYSESNFTGIVADFMAISFFFIYSVAFWIVGWGST
jgi:polyisoprenoid-binding protein YceI